MTRARAFLLGASVGALGAALTYRFLTRPSASRPNVTPALDEVNDAFHASYDDVRATAEDEAPALVLLGDTLVVCTHDRRVEIPVSPPRFHAIKAAAHAPVAAYALLHPERDATLGPSARSKLEKLRQALAQSLDQEPERGSTAAEMLGATRLFVADALKAGQISRDVLSNFARSAGRMLTRLTEEATELQLSALDAATERALGLLSSVGHAHVQVVVAGDHQARTRSLGMQYFQLRLAEAPDADLRVTYGEGVTTVDEALSLVGKQRFDRELALAFFGDAKQLQQDVLGDAAAALLARIPPKSL